jgi:hypothetical protein
MSAACLTSARSQRRRQNVDCRALGLSVSRPHRGVPVPIFSVLSIRPVRHLPGRGPIAATSLSSPRTGMASCPRHTELRSRGRCGTLSTVGKKLARPPPLKPRLHSRCLVVFISPSRYTMSAACLARPHRSGTTNPDSSQHWLLSVTRPAMICVICSRPRLHRTPRSSIQPAVASQLSAACSAAPPSQLVDASLRFLRNVLSAAPSQRERTTGMFSIPRHQLRRSSGRGSTAGRDLRCSCRWPAS